jgi:Secretin and TonB N terminus short domain.
MHLFKTTIHTILIILLILPSATFAQEKKQTVTIQQTNISLQDAFALIETQTNYSIAYEQSAFDMNKMFALSLKEADIENALKQILKETPCNYTITGYHIIISLPSKEEATIRPNPERLSQTIRGIIIDAKTNAPIEFASVGVINTAFGSVTDSLGRFRISNVPIGRYNLQASFMGYNTHIINEIQVTSSKEVYVEILLNENMYALDEVLVRPEVKKDKLLNTMAIGGGRMISMEEAGRFANGFDDPARLSMAFAGVAGNMGTNAIAIRGNSPQFTQWRLEGVEVPNPSHFADIGGLGGGILSALSTQVIGNSDFLNGAFPAEYNNALSGVFDIYMRTGNNQKYEHTFQVGLLGIDLASEGPISKKDGSSYLFNYRRSTTDLVIPDSKQSLKFQDLAFKLNFPTKKAGTFSFWGLGLIDKYTSNMDEDKTKWETLNDRAIIKSNIEKLTGGLTHKYLINDNMYIRSTLMATYANDHAFVDIQTLDDKKVHLVDIRNSKWDFVFNSYLNTKLSSRHTNRTGVTVTRLNFDLDYQVSPNWGLAAPIDRIARGNGNSTVLSVFSTSRIDLNNYLTTSIGINTFYFSLNDYVTLEPRVALKWKLTPKHALTASYGLHSRRERLDYYFIEQETNGKKETNKYLSFSEAHHFGLTYDWNINQNLHLKIEPYYQYLFNMPVEEGSSFSIINHEDVYLERILKNNGLGKNYGLEITMERYMENGFYYLLTGSVFKSKYMGGDKIWRNTRLDKGYMYNILAGKEWMVGKHKQNVIGINGRVFYHGGDRYSPIDEEKSNEEKDVVFDETKAYSKKFDATLNGDISMSFKMNKKKISHEFTFKLLNLGATTGKLYYLYNEKDNYIKEMEEIGVVPNLSYKIYF